MASSVTTLRSVHYRLGQGIRALRPTPLSSAEKRSVERRLTDGETALFDSMPIYGQRHAYRVFRVLVSAGIKDEDVLVAGLLHDVGKSDSSSPQTVFHRTCRVLIESVPNSVSRSLYRVIGASLTSQIARAHVHEEKGAELAWVAGCSERTCWLIRMHSSKQPSRDIDLLQLQHADSVS